ncbi:hypothetical protein E3N88_04636 [Mikania micrantha]|uniref:Histone H2A n=1 Tax=Mikania micrantha TaxID=192012 RepID=A0A5N6PX45_9ASTR|nr:hypothetical protein E3N88_04636 [Mikania micrantha]
MSHTHLQPNPFGSRQRLWSLSMQRHQIYQGSFLGADLPATQKTIDVPSAKDWRRGRAWTFSVGRIRCCLKNGRYAKRVEIGVPVYLAAIFEYLVVERQLSCEEASSIGWKKEFVYSWISSIVLKEFKITLLDEDDGSSSTKFMKDQKELPLAKNGHHMKSWTLEFFLGYGSNKATLANGDSTLVGQLACSRWGS